MERLSDLLCFSEETDDFLSPGVTGATAQSRQWCLTGWADPGVWNAGTDAVSYVSTEEALQSI